MKRLVLCELAGILAAWLVLAAMPSIVHAQDSPWASRPGSFLTRTGDVLILNAGRATRRSSSLENHWESQRQAQQELAQSHGPVRFGFYGGYYSPTTATRTAGVEFVTSYPAGLGTDYGAVFDDLYYERKYDFVDPIDYADLCSNHSSVNCLDGLHRTGRR
jgi:hypothetical protein